MLTNSKYRCNIRSLILILQFSPSCIYSRILPHRRSDKLGSIYQTINWSSLIELLPKKKTMAGAPSWLPPQGYFGLMFLKHYTKLSDEKLLERFNTDWFLWFMQLMAYKNLYISPFEEHMRKHDGLAAWAVPLLQTLFMTSIWFLPSAVFLR